MAQKAAKSLASRNIFTLRRNHLATVALHLLFLLLQILGRSRSWFLYFIFCSPAVATEIYLDAIGRPEYSHDGFLRRPGQDLGAPGLTEFMWDIVYWTWINLLLVGILGDQAWWLYLAVPIYIIYLGVATVGGLKGMLSPPSEGVDVMGPTASESKRQQKLGKRAQQRMAYQSHY